MRGEEVIDPPMTDWRRYRLLTGGERRLLHRAFFALPLVALGRRLFGMRRLQEFLVRTAAGRRLPSAGDARSAAGLVAAAAGRLPLVTPTCLERSLALWWLLRRRGHEVELYVGVRPLADGVEAHAWVESGGEVLNDRGDVKERFAAFHNPLEA